MKKDLPLPFSCSVVSFLCLHPSVPQKASAQLHKLFNMSAWQCRFCMVWVHIQTAHCTACSRHWKQAQNLRSRSSKGRSKQDKEKIRGGSKGQLNPEVLVAPCLKRATSCELFSGIALTSGATSVLSPPLPQKQNRQRRIHKARSAPPINERAYPQGPWLTPWGKWERGAQT